MAPSVSHFLHTTHSLTSPRAVELLDYVARFSSLYVGTRLVSGSDTSRSIQLDDERLAALQLAMAAGIGPRTQQALLSVFGSPIRVLSAAPSELAQVPGIGPRLLRSLVAAPQNPDVQRELEICRANRISLLHESDANYPRALQEIPDPPGVLFYTGDIQPVDAMAIAIVGTRHASYYGKNQAHRLAGGLARAGITIVSGLARGIDAAAHRGALEAGGRTIAITASGVMDIYPPEHKELASGISCQGAVMSENPATSRPKSGMFPQRNRIITGLSLGVVVVEAAERSGALISASHAVDQNREVFAVPGRIDSRTSRGCHRLLRDGAKLVTSVDDVIEELGPLIESTPTSDGREIRRPAELRLNDQEQQVLVAIDTEPTSIEKVVVESGLPIHRVLSTISVLETRKLVRRVSGHVLVRV